MDRSVDSIGSCSLDVDAESTDISDTSGSLNFPTPVSIKDITRDFTANFRERSSLHTAQNCTTFINPVTGELSTVLTQPTISADTSAFSTVISVSNHSTNSDYFEKKPSYLNLACCVNGYSNLTTYDSKIRQDINKSREVSPIRPSTTSIHYCKKNNSLAPPILLTMPNPKGDNTSYSISSEKKHVGYEANNNNGRIIHANGSTNGIGLNNGNNGDFQEEEEDEPQRSGTSFIQQRVERLYGPGALAPGFYSPKKFRNFHSPRMSKCFDSGETSELSQKFKTLSPSRDFDEFKKKLPGGASNIALNTPTHNPKPADIQGNDLPVMRHLSDEFRAQLPAISPKKVYNRNINVKNEENKASLLKNLVHSSLEDSTLVHKSNHKIIDHNASDHKIVDNNALDKTNSKVKTPSETITSPPRDEVDRDIRNANISSDLLTNNSTNKNSLNKSIENETQNPIVTICAPKCELPIDPVKKDGHYFLNVLNKEQVRILSLASEAEEHIEYLTNINYANEEILGFLRSAAGKARLLVTQKMKQFEGLCHNNLNQMPEDKFPTTVDDLQGFWDMVNLQVDHINALFGEINILKNNDWKQTSETSLQYSSPATPSNTSKLKKSLKSSSSKCKPSPNITPKVASATALKREEQRKLLQEMKRKSRMAMNSTSDATELSPKTSVTETGSSTPNSICDKTS